MLKSRDANNNQGNNTSLTASRHSLKRFRAFKSHKSEKHNVGGDRIDGTANLPSTSSSSSASTQLLSRPIEKVFEEAQLSLTLNLNDRKLKEFPEELARKYDLSDLICAELANNRLTVMPDFLSSAHLDSLETLVLRKNCLRGQLFLFPSNLKTISYLDLSGNQLSSLPDCLFNLPLKVLLLSANRLDSLSPQISHLGDTLEELDLSYNRLRECPIEIGMLNLLNVLNLRNNQLEELTPAVSQIPRLRLLALSNNQLSCLPSQLHVFAGALRSGIELLVDGNPLISPPIGVARKGRLHMAKWLRNLAVDESNKMEDGGEAKNRNAVNNRCEENVSQSLKSHTKSSIMASKSVSAALQSEPGKSFGSDSGYASTVDEHRFSHEYNNGSLEDICENQQKDKLANKNQAGSEKNLCTGDLNKEIMLAYAQTVMEKKKASSVAIATSCLKQTFNNNDSKFLPLQQTTNQPSLETKTIAQYRQNAAVSKCINPSTSLLSPVLEVGSPSHENVTRNKLAAATITAKPNTKANKPSQLAPKSLSSSCSPCSSMCSVVENLPTATIKIADTSVVPPKKVEQPKTSKQMTTSVHHQPCKTGQLKAGLNGVKNGAPKNVCLPAKPESKQLTKPAGVAKSTPVKTALPTSNRVHPTSNMSRSTISAAKPTPTTQRRGIKADSIPPPETIDKIRAVKGAENGKETGVRKANSTLNLPKKAANSSSSSSPSSQAQAMAAIVYEEQDKVKSVVNAEDVEKMMDELADGVLLCQLVNKYRPKVVPVVLTVTAAEKSVPPPKARRNIENFLAACRKLGVSEASICAATDIMGRQRNSAQLARTVIALSKCAKK